LLQFLSAPNVLHDLHDLEEAMLDHSPAGRGTWTTLVSDRARRRLFLLALERGFLDSALDRVIVDPFQRTARLFAQLDEWLCDAVLPSRRPAPIDGGDRDE
jgi:hypothetical protein